MAQFTHKGRPIRAAHDREVGRLEPDPGCHGLRSKGRVQGTHCRLELERRSVVARSQRGHRVSRGTLRRTLNCRCGRRNCSGSGWLEPVRGGALSHSIRRRAAREADADERETWQAPAQHSSRSG